MKKEDEKILLIVRAFPNYEKGKPEYDWEFPSHADISRMLGVLDLIKFDLMLNWMEQQEELE